LQRNLARFVSNFTGQFQSRRKVGVHDDKLADQSAWHEGRYDVVSIDSSKWLIFAAAVSATQR
jgi:hypothetical protein